MRIVVVDDGPLFREGLKVVLQREGDLEVVGEADDARAGFRLVDQLKPDLVVMDLVLPGMDGVAAVREVRRRSPETNVLLLSGHRREREVLEGFAAGARGFAFKTQPLAELLGAVRATGKGQTYAPAGVAPTAVSAAVAGGASFWQHHVLGGLTEREREVFELVVRGLRNRAIARELCIAIKTVESHRARINQKLACRSTADLVRFAAGNGLLREPLSALDGSVAMVEPPPSRRSAPPAS